MSIRFDYSTAFSRNIGWVTEREQAILRGKRVAIAGLGGVGGSHLLTLVRLGVGVFHISDFDTFNLVNFNRQAGASMSHLGRPKVDVLVEMALDINPELEIRTFPEGVKEDNVQTFLDGIDIYVDGLDFFAVAARRMVFTECAERGIPATTAAPLGMGVSVLNFLPGKTTFEQYFRLEGQPENEQLLRFLAGLSPVKIQMGALVDDTRLNLEEHRGPSTPMGCELCAGMAATQALKILLRRGPVVAAPRGLHFDAFSNRKKITWRPGGNDNPLQRLGLAIARKRIAARPERQVRATAAKVETHAPETPMQRVLDLARWAPSGDNTQPWRFTLTGEHACVVHGNDTREWCVYDLQGRASQIALGALLETIAVAASGEGMRAEFQHCPDTQETAPQIEVELVPDSSISRDALCGFIKERVTQRRALSTEPLATVDKQRLQASLPDGFRVQWIEGGENKKRMANLLFLNAKIRLTIPEAYRVHKEIIEWNARYSEDRIPDQAVGLDPVALKLMRWALHSWKRVSFLNRYLAGTWMPRIQLDLVPGLRCAAHFVLVADNPPERIGDYLAAGRALQRFWLTCASCGLQFQPEMTPLIFSGYLGDGIQFTRERAAQKDAEVLKQRLESLAGPDVVEHGVFMGRVGYGAAPSSRSIRLPLTQLNKQRLQASLPETIRETGL